MKTFNVMPRIIPSKNELICENLYELSCATDDAKDVSLEAGLKEVINTRRQWKGRPFLSPLTEIWLLQLLMAAEICLSSTPVCSPKPPLPVTSDLTVIEEGKASPSQASTTAEVAAASTNAHKIIAELVGTYVIVFAGCGSLIVDKKYQQLAIMGVAVAWGLAVMVMIYSLGHVSGGHFNPAITIAFATCCKFPWKQVPAYIASQLAGSTMAILTLAVMFHHDNVDIRVTVTDYLHPTTDLQAFICEFIISFILMLSICGVVTDRRAISELSGVTVGAAVIINFLIAGKVTGASMNPARSIGPALIYKEFRRLWIYISAPILGMIAATLIYSLLRLPPCENFAGRMQRADS